MAYVHSRQGVSSSAVGDDDHVVLNIEIDGIYDNNSQNQTVAEYKVTKSQPIINNPSDFHLFVERFSIPGSALPLAVFSPTDPGIVTLTYNGASSFTQLVWVPGSGVPATDPRYYFEYSFLPFVNMVNTAFATAHAALAGVPAGSNPPQLVYNEELEKFQLFAESAYYDQSLALPIEVYFSSEIYNRLPFWTYNTNNPYTLANREHWQIAIEDHLINNQTIATVNYLVVTDQGSVASYWNAAETIVFSTSSIPVKNQWTDYGTQVGNNDSSANNKPILADFKLSAPQMRAGQTQILYIPRTSVNLIDLYSDEPLKKLDVSISWADKTGTVHPLLIPFGERATIKLLFVRKFSSIL